MNNDLETLKDILLHEDELHAQLVQLAGQMQQALKERRAERIQSITQSYDEVTLHIERLEEARLALCDKLNVRSGHTNLTAIIKVLPEKQQQEFQAIRSRLKEKISRLVKLNTANNIMLQESLAAMNQTMADLAASNVHSPGYQHSGRKSAEPQSVSMFNHVA
ncbi:MAG: hypothetical protein GF398_04915 [Chitinivibrionales bacterium]|nr:hypothetical protein [Chitinivibrionales bacterium]